MEELEYNYFYISKCLIRRVWYNGEWRYCVSDFILYLTRVKDPIRYIIKIRIRNPNIKILWNDNIRKFLLKTDKGNREANCGNLKLLSSIVRVIPKKYKWRFRIFKLRI